ncbi:MAG TPA: M15 family metallopeptidase [Polyangiaceae bacterium]|nr:M15 family metallopeptidase [Polyangiaceae bacterium]
MALDGDNRGSARSPTRTLLIGLGLAVPVAVIAVDVVFIARGRGWTSRAAAPAPAASGATGGSVRAVATSTVQFPDGDDDTAAPDVDAAIAASSESDAHADDGEAMDDDGAPEEPSSAPAKPAPSQHFATVQDAAAGSCTTVSVEGLSKQIIEQARCLNPKAVVPLPSRPNLVTGPHVFPYMQADARDHLVRVLDAHKSAQMKLNSALRTVAQQYLVWRWSASKSCGVELATRPGESNHELGLALDVAEHASWRSALEAEQFRWLGASDRVHFDYKTADAQPRKMTDVLAFQKLWNRNHPKDPVNEDGLYSAATEVRLKKAPPDGFEIGPSCGKATKHAQ